MRLHLSTTAPWYYCASWANMAIVREARGLVGRSASVGMMMGLGVSRG